MRIVIDSNVWISALVFGGKPRMVLEFCVEHGVVIAISAELMTETRRILHDKFPDFIEDYEDLLVILGRQLQIVQIGTQNIKASRDPDDNMVIETAVQSNSSHIISGDKDLLVLSRYNKIHINTPAEFLTRR